MAARGHLEPLSVYILYLLLKAFHTAHVVDDVSKGPLLTQAHDGDMYSERSYASFVQMAEALSARARSLADDPGAAQVDRVAEPRAQVAHLRVHATESGAISSRSDRYTAVSARDRTLHGGAPPVRLP